MNRTQLNNLYNFIDSLNLTRNNRKWLSKKLTESVIASCNTEECSEPPLMSKEDFFAKIDKSKQQAANGKTYRMMPEESLEEFINRV